MALLVVGCGSQTQPGPTSTNVPRVPAEARVAPKPSSIVDIEVGGDTACALRDDGVVFCWGDTYRATSSWPLRVEGLPPVKTLSVGEDHSCAIDEDDRLWCWGRPARAQAGAAGGTSGEPHLVEALPRMRRVSVGGDTWRDSVRLCAIGTDDVMTCMGTRGGLERYDDLGAVDEVAVGDSLVCILKGGVQHCADRRGSRSLPSRFWPRRGANALTTVVVSGHNHCGSTAQGSLFCWGSRFCEEHRFSYRNGKGPRRRPRLFEQWRDQVACQLAGQKMEIRRLSGADTGMLAVGEGTTEEWYVDLGGYARHRSWETDYDDVSRGRYFSCGLERGEVSCWGASHSGQLGIQNWPLGRRYRLPYPDVSARDSLICAHDPSVGVRCWASASSVNMGNDGWLRGDIIPGTAGASGMHVNALGACVDTGKDVLRCTVGPRGTLSGWPASDVQRMGGATACSVHGDGKLRCRFDSSEVEIVEFEGQPLLGVTDLSVEASWAVAVNGEGVYTFQHGQASLVPGLRGATQVAAGEGFGCAVIDRKVSCWGQGASGQLGTGDGRSRPAPSPVPGLPPVTTVRAGRSHVCAVSEGGRLYCWGDNYYGTLGEETRRDAWSARLVAGVEGIVDAALGASVTCAMRANDTICWGHRAAIALDPDREAATPPPRDVPQVVRGFGEEPPESKRELVEVMPETGAQP